MERDLNAAVVGFLNELERSIARSQHKITLFTEKLNENADYNFAWADNAMAVAADMQVKKHVRAVIDDAIATDKAIDVVIADLYNLALRTTLNAAEYPERSSSVVSNFQAQLRGAAWAEMTRSLASLKG